MTPHEQFDQTAPVDVQRRLWQLMTGLANVSVGPSGISIPSTKALHLNPRKATGPATAFLIGTEFAHLHGEHDGSLHVALPFDEAAEAVEKGWAEYHPLVKMGVLPQSMVMLYGPRDDEELEIVWRLVQSSHRLACGKHD